MDPDVPAGEPGEQGAQRTLFHPADGAVSTNGHRPRTDAPAGALQPPRQPVGRGPALVVGAIAAVLTLGGFLAAVLGSSSGAKHPRATAQASGLVAEPAAAALAPIARATQPPKGVVARLVVPQHWRAVSHSCNSGGVDLYDCAVYLHVPAAPPAVVSFYKAELHQLGWTKLAITPTDHGLGTEVLEQVANSDGYYWDVGVFVDPVTSSTAPAGGSTVEVRVVERGDGS